MIVNLLRNNISLISKVGTLDVPELFRIGNYPTLRQMVNRVRAKLLPMFSIEQVFAALLPLPLEHRRAEDPCNGDPSRLREHPM